MMGSSVLVFFAVTSLVSGLAQQKWHKSVDGSRFYIETEQKFTWFGSWNECARKNMSLIAIDSYEKHVQFDVLIKTIPPASPPYWIGGHDNDIAERHEWAATGEIFTFTNWGPGQPKRGDNHCILIWTDWNWHDWPCTKKLGFICEENRYIKEKSVELEALKKDCEDKLNGINKFKNIVTYINPKIAYSYGNGTDTVNLKMP